MSLSHRNQSNQLTAFYVRGTLIVKVLSAPLKATRIMVKTVNSVYLRKIQVYLNKGKTNLTPT